jgi:phosphoribosylglycinamide formyltransferase 1
MRKKLNIGVLISGRGSNYLAIADACDSGEINGQIVAVGSDNPEAEGLEKAKKRGHYTFLVDYKKAKEIYKECKDVSTILPADFDYEKIFAQQTLFSQEEKYAKALIFYRTRAMVESEVIDEFRTKGVELVVLAGFEKIVTLYFINAINVDKERIMNIHPAILPAFPGTDGYGDTLEYGCKVGGCTVHFVDGGMDTGPIIGQMAYVINPGDTLKIIKDRGLANEWQLYPECIRMFEEDRLRVIIGPKGRRVVDILPAA